MEATFSYSLFFLSLTVLFFTFLASADFFLVLRQVYTLSLAKISHRNAYKKRAVQALSLTFVLNILLFVLSSVDLFFFHVLSGILPYEAYTSFSLLPFFALLSMFSLLLWKKDVQKSQKPKIRS